jgi:hypothetical protein
VRRRRRRSYTPQAALAILGVAILVSLPLFLVLQADPTLQQRVDQLSGPLAALQAGDARPVLASTLATLGVFSFTGDPRWTYTLPQRPLFDPLTSLLFTGGLALALLRAPRRPRDALVLIWLAITLLPSALAPQAPSTVRLVGAIPVVYLLTGLAAGWLWQRTGETRRHLRPLTIAALSLLLILNVARTVDGGFRRWPAALETRLRYARLSRRGRRPPLRARICPAGRRFAAGGRRRARPPLPQP